MFQKVLELQNNGQVCILATITQVKGSAPREVGAKMLIARNQVFGTIGGGSLEQLVISLARELLTSTQGQKLSVPLCSRVSQCCGGYVEIFMDIIQPQPQLVIFGAGHVAQAVLEVMAGTEFYCRVIDERPEWTDLARQKQQTLSQLSLVVETENPIQWMQKNSVSLQNAYCLVMTHDHHLDQELVEHLIGLDLKYLGLIGSKTKRQRFVQRLFEKGLSLSELEKLRCPIGKSYQGNYKSKLPKAVAISIGFELVEIYAMQTQAEQTTRTELQPQALSEQALSKE